MVRTSDLFASGDLNDKLFSKLVNHTTYGANPDARIGIGSVTARPGVQIQFTSLKVRRLDQRPPK